MRASSRAPTDGSEEGAAEEAARPRVNLVWHQFIHEPCLLCPVVTVILSAIEF